jgi:hypothetical protein
VVPAKVQQHFYKITCAHKGAYAPYRIGSRLLYPAIQKIAVKA